MKNRTLVILLGLSLIFNVFFIFAAMRHQPPRGPMAEIHQVANDLDLDHRQVERLTELRQNFTEESALIRRDLAHAREQMATLLEAESVDAESMRNLLAIESELQHRRRELAGRQFGHFLELLSPKQRHDLSRRMHQDQRTRHRDGDFPAHMLERFDGDGDGSLSEEERSQAQTHLDRRHQRQSKWRREMQRKFDADNDGSLSAEEREAMRNWLLEEGLTPPDHGAEGSPQGRNGRFGGSKKRGEGRPHGKPQPPDAPLPPSTPPVDPAPQGDGTGENPPTTS